MGGQARFSSRLQLAIAFVSVFWLTVQAHYVPYLDQVRLLRFDLIDTSLTVFLFHP
jgi:hypothetical protein